MRPGSLCWPCYFGYFEKILNTHESIILCKSFHVYKKLHVSIDWQTIRPGGLQGSTGLAVRTFELDI
jgi:hypothetical protein